MFPLFKRKVRPPVDADSKPSGQEPEARADSKPQPVVPAGDGGPDVAASAVLQTAAAAVPDFQAVEGAGALHDHAVKNRAESKTSAPAMKRLFGSLFERNPKLDENLLEAIETTLLAADVGFETTEVLVESLRQGIGERRYADAAALRLDLRARLIAQLAPVATPLDIDPATKPFVVLVVGINGVGKTTTIGKLARRYADEGRKVLLAAGDTFRAAAVEQLKVWGARNRIEVLARDPGADASSVIFDAIRTATSAGIDLLIADTAGRLHTQAGLMDELSKIRRVIAKADATAPHEVLAVVDGTTGQNALNQVRQFHKAAAVTGLVITKLDGSAKGGVVFALAREFGLPIRFVGMGEGIHDLRAFDAETFVDTLLAPAADGQTTPAAG